MDSLGIISLVWIASLLFMLYNLVVNNRVRGWKPNANPFVWVFSTYLLMFTALLIPIYGKKFSRMAWWSVFPSIAFVSFFTIIYMFMALVKSLMG